MFSGAAAELFQVGQAFEPDALTLRRSEVRLESPTYRLFEVVNAASEATPLTRGGIPAFAGMTRYQGIHRLALPEESFGLVLKDCASSRPGDVENSFLKPYPSQQVLKSRV